MAAPACCSGCRGVYALAAAGGVWNDCYVVYSVARLAFSVAAVVASALIALLAVVV